MHNQNNSEKQLNNAEVLFHNERRWGERASDLVTWAQTDLVEATGFSLSTVVRSLDELKSKNWIETWEPGGRWARGTTYRMYPLYANGKDPEAT